MHIPNGVFVADNGWELVGAIAGLLLALAAAGSGRYGVDHVVRSRQAPADAPPEPVPPLPWPHPATHRSAPHDVPPPPDRASAFTEVFPQVPADVPGPPLPVRRPRPTPSPHPEP